MHWTKGPHWSLIHLWLGIWNSAPSYARPRASAAGMHGGTDWEALPSAVYEAGLQWVTCLGTGTLSVAQAHLALI